MENLELTKRPVLLSGIKSGHGLNLFGNRVCISEKSV